MAECQCSFFWFSSQLTFIFFSALKFMLIHDKDTCTMLADTEFLLSVITTRNGEKKQRKRKRNIRKLSYQYGLDRWSPWVASENVSPIKRRENNTFIKIFKHAGSFVTILFARIIRFTCLLFLYKCFSIRFSYFSTRPTRLDMSYFVAKWK